MTDAEEKSDALVVPTKSPNEARSGGRRGRREGAQQRGTRKSKTRPGHSAGTTRNVRSTVCAKLQQGTGSNDSRRSFIM
jgi:hypothetical protein